MKLVYLSDEIERQKFAKDAADHFERHLEHSTFSSGEIVPGCLFAVRWGFRDDCVLVFKLSNDFEPIVYKQIIKKEKDL